MPDPSASQPQCSQLSDMTSFPSSTSPNATDATTTPARPTPEVFPPSSDLNKVVILHPGSSHLYFGIASDAQPKSLPQLVVRKHKRQKHLHEQSFEDALLPTDSPFDITTAKTGLKAVEAALSTSFSSKPLSSFNKEVTPQHTHLPNEKPANPGLMEANCLVGDSAVRFLDSCSLTPSQPRNFNLHLPIRRGRLNLHSGVGGSLSSIMQDLEDIWTEAIVKHLNIPLKELRNLKAILLIPDLFERHHVAAMFDVIIRKLGFSAAFLQMESVCSCFGAGLVSGCVVDVGDAKTSISCVEDGIAHASSILQVDIGGSDLTRTWAWLLKRIHFPYRECNLLNRHDAKLMSDLKEKYCHCDLSLMGLPPQEKTLLVNIRSRSSSPSNSEYNMKIGDEGLIAPMAFFFPELFGLSDLSVHRCRRPLSQPDDIFDDDYLVQSTPGYTRRKYAEESFVADEGKGAGDPMDEDSVDPPETLLHSSTTDDKKSASADDSIMQMRKLGRGKGIEFAVLKSVALIGGNQESEDLKRRMLSNVVIVGGGLAKFAANDSLMKERILSSLDRASLGLTNPDPVTVEVTTSAQRDTDPRHTCWKGAAIMSGTETTAELWIQAWEWKAQGSRVLRERCPFVW